MNMNLTRWLGLDSIIFAGVGLIVFAVLVVLGWQIAAADDPIRPRVFRGETVTDDSRRADVAGTIAERAGNSVVVQDVDGTVEVEVSLDTVIQTLVPEQVDGVQLGDWVFVGGSDDNVNSFIVKAVVVVDEAGVR